MPERDLYFSAVCGALPRPAFASGPRVHLADGNVRRRRRRRTRRNLLGLHYPNHGEVRNGHLHLQVPLPVQSDYPERAVLSPPAPGVAQAHVQVSVLGGFNGQEQVGGLTIPLVSEIIGLKQWGPVLMRPEDWSRGSLSDPS